MWDFFLEGADSEGGSPVPMVCRQTEGALGIGNAEARDRALLMQWLWRFPKKRIPYGIK